MRNRYVRRLSVIAGVALAWIALGFSATPAHASSITFITPSGATTSGGAVDASATFTTSVGSLEIQLTDLEANPKSVAQALSGLSFTVAHGSLVGATLTTSSGQLITIGKDGKFTLGSTGSTGWSFAASGGGASGMLDVLGGKPGPAHLIIGPPSNGGTYSNANGSIAGNGPHNPFINETATFTITGQGITADTTITGATFAFGTTTGADLVGGVRLVHGAAVPEPSSVILSASGFGILAVLGFCRSRRRQSVTA